MAAKDKPPVIRHRPLSELRPDPNNARTHGPAQVERLAGLMLTYGVTFPILAGGDGLIAAGHGRYDAAAKVYADGGKLAYPNGDPIPDGTFPTLDCTGWTPEQRRAYVLADNQVATEAGWNLDVLSAELEALAGADFDLASIGFDEDAMAALADLAGGDGRSPTPPDQFPEFDEGIETTHECPKCSYKWSGKPS